MLNINNIKIVKNEIPIKLNDSFLRLKNSYSFESKNEKNNNENSTKKITNVGKYFKLSIFNKNIIFPYFKIFFN